jgi:hypothetical protein
MIKNHGSTFLKASLKDKDSIRRSLSTNVNKKSSINLESLGLLGKNLQEKVAADDYFGLYSTSQLKDSVDFSKFENHTFYDSAEAKVNYAFNRIINHFPFEGTYEDYESFLRNLDGFTNYVLENMTFNLGYLKFLGNSYIEVKDQSGALFTTADQNTGNNILDPKTSQFSFDFWIYVPSDSNDDKQIVFQKLSSSNNGFTCYLENPNNTETEISLLISNLKSGLTQSYHNFVKAKTSIKKDRFNHICFNVKNKIGKRIIDVYVNGEKKDIEVLGNDLPVEQIDFRNDSLFIGKGSNHIIDSGATYSDFNVQNSNPLNAALDDLRIFHSVRPQKEIKESLRTNIYKRSDLKLYFKFNEPPGSYQNINVVMDHSSNSLHSKIVPIAGILDVSALREKYDNVDTPLDFEDLKLSPVLFPDYNETISLRNSLFKVAHSYDQNNPNLIFKLFPKQYFDGQSQKEGFDSLYGNISKPFTYREALAGSVVSPAIGNFVSLLLIWARYFDTIKLYIDNYTEVINVDYDSLQQDRPGASVYLPKIAKFLGFNFTQIVNNPSLRNLQGKDLQYNNSEAEFTIRKVQNEIWKRLLINSQDFIRQKGTKESLKSIIRAAGLDPDLFYNIKEKTGISDISLKETYVDQKNTLKSFDFSDNVTQTPILDNVNESATNKKFLRIDKLVNTAQGLYDGPFKASTNVNALNDSSLSGSWEIEGFYRFPLKNLTSYNLSQSLGRITTVSLNESQTYLTTNIVLNKKSLISKDATIHFISRPYDDQDAQTIYLTSSEIPIFDGNIYRVSVGQKRSELGLRNKSEYFLNVQKCGEEAKSYDTESKTYYLYDDQANQSYNDIHKKYNANYNKRSENFSFHIGSFKFDTNVGSVNDTTLGQVSRTNEINNLDVLTNNFQGEVFGVNVYSKNLLESERLNHAKNIRSVGTSLPSVNYHFNNFTTGSNQRLNLQVSPYATNLSSSFDGTRTKIKLTDRTQNSYTNAFFEIKSNLSNLEESINSNYFVMKSLNTEIDTMTENNKVRLLSDYSDESIVYERPLSFNVEEDNRFIVEMTNTFALNKDISSIMSSLDEFNNALGDTASLFDIQYRDINVLRNIYFNNLSESIENRSLYTIYKYMDNLISDLLRQMVPDKAFYTGHNYTITSHILERHKIQYKYSQNRIPNVYRSHYFSRRNIYERPSPEDQ